MYPSTCHAQNQTTYSRRNHSSQRHTWFWTWDYKLGLFYWTSLFYREEKNFLSQLTNWTLLMHFKFIKSYKAKKRTFIFKLYSSMCVYKTVLQCIFQCIKITFYSVVFHYSVKNTVTCIFYFKLNFSSNLGFSSLLNTFLSTDLCVSFYHLSNIFQRKLTLSVMNKTDWFYFSNLKYFNYEAKQIQTESYHFGVILTLIGQDTSKTLR